MKLRKLIERLIDNAMIEPFLRSTRRKGTPGEVIARLKPEERELLVAATPANFQDFRRDYLKLFIGTNSDQRIIEDKKKLEKKFNRRKMVG